MAPRRSSSSSSSGDNNATVQVNGRIIRKRIHVRVEHVVPSRCREDFLSRRAEHERLKKDAKEKGGASASTLQNTQAAAYSFLLQHCPGCMLMLTKRVSWLRWLVKAAALVHMQWSAPRSPRSRTSDARSPLKLMCELRALAVKLHVPALRFAPTCHSLIRAIPPQCRTDHARIRHVAAHQSHLSPLQSGWTNTTCGGL